MLRLVQRAEPAQQFERPEGMPEALFALLCVRGISSVDEAYRLLQPSIDQLHDPMQLSSMAESLDIIASAKSRGDTICIYGDYDVDGVCAAAILYQVLKRTGHNVRTYIPSRHDEGYGLNVEAVTQIAEYARLLITVDCGVTAVEQIDACKALGLAVIVTDHHRPKDILPDCPIINPLLDGYPFPSLCGAGVAFKLAQAIDPELALEQLDLCALATVADMVPLTGENRVIVALGLESIKRQQRPGIMALCQSAGIDPAHLRAGNIAFQLAPRINAGGRLGDADRALELMLTGDQEKALALAAELEGENTLRKGVEQEILLAAVKQMDGFDFINRRVIVLHGEDWNVGVIGLAASRLVERYHLPVVMLSGASGVLTGSCRSIQGVDIHQALAAHSELLERFGGHKQAAGLSIKRERVAQFALALSEFIAKTCDPTAFVPAELYDVSAELSELDDRLIKLISRLEPFGFGNPQPAFLSDVVVRSCRQVGKDGAHLSLKVAQGGSQFGAIWYRAGALAQEMTGEKRMLYNPKLNEFNGNISVQLEVRTALPPRHIDLFHENTHGWTSFIQLFLTERLYNIGYHVKTANRYYGFEEIADKFIDSPYGTLVVATDIDKTAEFLEFSAEFGAEHSFDLLFGRWPDDERPMNAVCVCPAGEQPKGYARLFMLDAPGSLIEGELEIFEPDEARAAWLDELPDVDALRKVYLQLRDVLSRPLRASSLTQILSALTDGYQASPVQVAAALPVLGELGLIELDMAKPALALKPMKKCDPDGSRLYQYIRSIAQWGR